MAVCSVSGSGCENDLCTAEALRTGVVVGWAIEEGLPEKVTLSQVFAAEQKELPAWGREGTRDEGEGIRWKGARSQRVQTMQWAPFLSVGSF